MPSGVLTSAALRNSFTARLNIRLVKEFYHISHRNLHASLHYSVKYHIIKIAKC